MFEWMARGVAETGYLGIALFMLAENIFPPIPSEVIMPLAGFAAADGDLHLGLVIVAGTAGSLAGAFLWYGVGHWFGDQRLKKWAARHGRWLTASPDDVDRARSWFRRHCGKAVLLGRMIPTVRTLISIPAGIVRMGLVRFFVYSGIGTAVWSGALAAAGLMLEDQYDKVGEYLDPVSNIVIGGLALGYLYRVATFDRRKKHETDKAVQ